MGTSITGGNQAVEAKQREKEFRADLAALLAKHGAEIEVTDDGKPYGMHHGVCRVSMDSVWEGDTLKKDFCEFDL